MATTTTLSYRPLSSRNWADDEEDDWNFESWKATADTSAPSIDELGPLQLPPAEDESSLLLTTSKIANEPVLRAANEQAPSIEELPSDQQPSDDQAPTVASIEESIEWQCKEAQDQLIIRALKDGSDAPAYPDLSYSNDGPWEPHVRTNYRQNWNRMKVDTGLDCRRPVLFRLSPLSQTSFVDEEEEDVMVENGESFDPFENFSGIALGEESEHDIDEDVQDVLGVQTQENTEAWEQFSEIAVEDLPEMELEGTSEEDEADPSTPPISPSAAILCEKNDEESDLAEMTSIDMSDSNVNDIQQDAQDAHISEAEPAKLNTHYTATTTNSEPQITLPPTTAADRDFDFADVFCDTYDADASDEGYLSSSPRISPPLSSCDDELQMRRKRTVYHYSTDALIELRKIAEDMDAVENAVEDIELAENETDAMEDSDGDVDKTEHLKYTNPDPTPSDYLASAVSTGWCFFSSVPWTAVGVVTAGAVVGALIHLTRRR